MIGNAVPVNLAYEIACGIKQALEEVENNKVTNFEKKQEYAYA